MNKATHSRSGDVNLRPIKKLPENLQEIRHNGSYVTARGEATGSVHLLEVKKKSDMVLMQDEQGNVYLQLFAEATHSHTKDHETVRVMPGIYKQIQEREVDNFSSEFLVRRVID